MLKIILKTFFIHNNMSFKIFLNKWKISAALVPRFRIAGWWDSTINSIRTMWELDWSCHSSWRMIVQGIQRGGIWTVMKVIMVRLSYQLDLPTSNWSFQFTEWRKHSSRELVWLTLSDFPWARLLSTEANHYRIFQRSHVASGNGIWFSQLWCERYG